jgi:spore coat-associated protein N
MKKILVSLMVIALVAGLIGAGISAYFSDEESSTGNTFTAGTLNIELGSGSWSGGFSYDNMCPGETVTFTIEVTSVGSLPLDYTVTADLNGDLAGGSNPCTRVVKIDGSESTADSLSAAGGGDVSDTITVEVTMPTAAGNEYQGKTGTLDITITATQQH